MGLVLRVGLSKEIDPTLNTSPARVFAQLNQDPIVMIINHNFMVSRNFASMLGLANMSGTWDPM